MFFCQIKDPGLAQYAYLIGCEQSKEAVIVDPERDIKRYQDIAADAGLKIIAATETHIHADYLSGLRQFAESGVKVFASDEGGNDWNYEWLVDSNYDFQLLLDGDTFSIGSIEFKVIHTPGHTPEHISFAVAENKDGVEKTAGILTGDFVFVGDVGRPDLLETAAGQEGSMHDAAIELYGSIQQFKKLPGDLMVWPGHGSGSACGKALGAAPMATIEQELKYNASLLAADNQQRFVEYILTGQPEPPYYFGRMKVENKTGPAVLHQMPNPKPLTVSELIDFAQAQNAQIIDTREWEMYKSGHLPGALFAPLSDRFETVVGSFVEPDSPVCLVIHAAHVNHAVTALVRIGIDNVACYTTPDQLEDFENNGGKVERIEEIHITDLKNVRDNDHPFVLDVRNLSELTQTGQIGGARNIAYTRLLPEKETLPKDRHLYIHCRSGNRSAFACGFLKKNGYRVTNVRGGIEDWVISGGEVTSVVVDKQD